MNEALVTQPSLLMRLRDPRDSQAWGQFVDRYGGLIYRFVRKRGLQDADAADLTQDVLQAVARSAGKLDYDPGKGTFRSWLFTITRHKLSDFLERRGRQVVGSGDSDAQGRLEQVARTDDGQEDWALEADRQLFHWAAEQVRGGFADNTWQAFWLTAVEGQSPQAVAERLGMTPGAVYVSKSRVLARLMKQIEQARADERLPWSPP
jgi:RNA polymerase sigma-70 factor (ECF subfamily)